MSIFPPNINRLKEKRDEEGLENALNFKRKSSIRLQAAKALGELGGHLKKKHRIPGTRSQLINVAWSLIHSAIDDEDEKVRNEAWDALIKIKATPDLIKEYNQSSRYQNEPIRSKFLYAFAKIGDWSGIRHVVDAYLFGMADVALLNMTGEKAVDCIKSSLWDGCQDNPGNFEYFERCFSTLSLLGGSKARNILEEYEIQQLARASNEEVDSNKEEKVIESEIKTGDRNSEGKLYFIDQSTINVYISLRTVKERREKAIRYRKVAGIARKILDSWGP